jgi:hypothetical protein
MSDQSAHTADHIESLRVGSLSVGGTTVVRQLLSCEFPSQGAANRSSILSTPLSIVDPVTHAKTTFQVPSNARIVGITVLPLEDPNPLCGETPRTKSALCMGFARCRRANTNTYGYKGALHVPTYGGVEAQTVKAVTESGSGNGKTYTPVFADRTIPIDLTNIEASLPLAGSEYGSKTTVGGATNLWPNAYHGLYRYLSPARMPAMALANRSFGVTYENADVLLSSKKPQYFEWNSTSSAASDEDQNTFLQMHLSVWTFDRTTAVTLPNATPTTPITEVYGDFTATSKGTGTAESDFYISLKSKVEVSVELVYELQSETPDLRERAYAR